MRIRDFEIGKGKTFVIAETCSNIIQHLDDLEKCVHEVALMGANAFKVQLFRAEHFPEREQDQKRRLEFPRKRFAELVELCHDYNLICGASVFDNDAVDLVENSGGDFLKLATREWDNDKLFSKCCQTQLPIISSYKSFRHSDPATFQADDRLLLMACIPEYPTYSISAMPIELTGEGWSSHTDHWIDCFVAIERGAVAIEKHVKFLPSDFEAGWSLSLNEFGCMVKDIRWMDEARVRNEH